MLPVLVLAAATAFPAGAQTVRAIAASQGRAPSSAAGSAASPGAAATPILGVPNLSFSVSAFSAPISAPAPEIALPPAAAPRRADGAVPAASPAHFSAATGAAPVPGSAAVAPTKGGQSRAAETALEAPCLDASGLFDGAAVRGVLERAAADDYTVTVLRKRGDGPERFAVILGEAHIKSAKSAAIGREVLARFTNYALENFDTTSTWARRFNWRLEMLARKRLSKKNPALYAEGSTIHAASDRAAAYADAHRYLLALAPEERARLLAAARASIAAGAPEDTQVLSDADPLMDAVEIVRLLEESGADASRKSPSPPKRDFDLEIGHRSDLAEKIALWKQTVEKAGLAALIVAALPVIAGDAASHSPAMLISLGIFGLIAALILNMSLGSTWTALLPNSRLGVLFPFQTGVIRARDKTMAANLASAFVSLPGGARVLAIVGKAHVRGMSAHLIERHGFEKAGLDALTRE